MTAIRELGDEHGRPPPESTLHTSPHLRDITKEAIPQQPHVYTQCIAKQKSRPLKSKVGISSQSNGKTNAIAQLKNRAQTRRSPDGRTQGRLVNVPRPQPETMPLNFEADDPSTRLANQDASPLSPPWDLDQPSEYQRINAQLQVGICLHGMLTTSVNSRFMSNHAAEGLIWQARVLTWPRSKRVVPHMTEVDSNTSQSNWDLQTTCVSKSVHNVWTLTNSKACLPSGISVCSALAHS